MGRWTAPSMGRPEQVGGRVSGPGPVTTGVVYSSPLERRPLSA
ncbi:MULTISPECIES: hypothetical protein [Streptomycetaceae]|uniref:Uncharacterized protein n=1 Tax=Streptantibioticus cattleyicolor (strain ATCC 35852 / DSM 46488 / JCM 4925 / NBRC 14057 / NRRL 8057) TaxID=1003195 RepID=G8WNJ5_STREN|nr:MULTISPECIES: hypothetical protein [Streptomycetaceae]AEW92757.1 hypothetical protein SCATT_03860 [Streptantibioticus cattleyicolor NRRL 8057 = DSM 46488]